MTEANVSFDAIVSRVQKAMYLRTKESDLRAQLAKEGVRKIVVDAAIAKVLRTLSPVT
jgi:hypothetical protein